MAKTLLWVLGVVFLLVGVLGFVPNPLVGTGALFETNLLHDVVHLAFGVVFILVAMMAADKAPMTLMVGGVVYLVVAILGFLMVPSGGDLLGLVSTNVADHWLHVVLAVVLIGAGYMAKDMPAASTM
jgi:hypothetical protein